ncbi:MAG: T9SS type A sorting domain-containing protein [Bacteroidetes bacterium]|nr:T9SS type A sorting domain-containing protein [Bacteroidota bacterium]
MKRLLPLCLMIASGVNTIAAPLTKSATSLHISMYNVILQKQAQTTAHNKTTGTLKRLVANSYTNNGVLTDTNHYYYSAGRGSTHTDVTSYYDEFYITAINPVHNILCDSSTNSHLYSGQWYQTASRAYTYDANNNILQLISHSYSTYSLHTPTYNANNKFETISMADSAAVPKVPTARMHIFYDGQNRRIMDSSYYVKTNKPYAKRVFTYDANGNQLQFNSYEYSTGTWQLTYRNTNTYDGSNRLITSVAELDFGQGMGLEFINKDSFAYTGAAMNPYYHIDYSWDATNTVWEPNEILLNHYNTASLLDTYYIVRYTTQWDTIERDVHTYDSNNLLIYSNGYNYLGNGSFSTTPYDQTVQYYEDYFPASVNTTTTLAGIVIYPNPAKEQLNISIQNNNPYNISIVNMAGQLQYTISGCTENTQRINTSGLARGSYIIQITDNAGKPLAQKQFIKD